MDVFKSGAHGLDLYFGGDLLDLRWSCGLGWRWWWQPWVVVALGWRWWQLWVTALG